MDRQEFIVDNVLHNLALDGRNLRVLFQQYDSKSYGYLTVDQVIVLLCMPELMLTALVS